MLARITIGCLMSNQQIVSCLPKPSYSKNGVALQTKKNCTSDRWREAKLLKIILAIQYIYIYTNLYIYIYKYILRIIDMPININIYIYRYV